MSERFDGFIVDSYGAKVSGTFDLEKDEGQDMKYGETVVCLVVTTVGPAAFKENSHGDMKRINTLLGESLVLISGQEAQDLLVTHGFPVQQTLTVTPAPASANPAKKTDVQSTADPEYDDWDEDDLPAAALPDADDDWSAWDTGTGEHVTTAAELNGERVSPSPSTVGASQAERDPMLAKFLEER